MAVHQGRQTESICILKESGENLNCVSGGDIRQWRQLQLVKCTGRGLRCDEKLISRNMRDLTK